jgi:hypothetical protein
MSAVALTALIWKVSRTAIIKMKEKNLVVSDMLSTGLLALWLVLVVVYFIFRPAVTLVHIDIAAWIAFGASLLLSGLPRWLYEITDTEVIGPFRLWIAAGTAALLLCMASSFIAVPKMKIIRQMQSASQNPSAQQRESLVRSYAKVNNFSVQFLFIRALLAAGMALGIKKLPRKQKMDM